MSKTKDTRDSKTKFVMHPLEHGTFPIVSIGKPQTGKSYLLNHIIQLWYRMGKNACGIYEEMHLVLPTFHYEQTDSYAYLREWVKNNKNVHIYETYSPSIVERILKRQKDFINKEKKKNPNSTEKPKPILLIIDDATKQRKSLFQSDLICELVTECRHINITFWALMHTIKGRVLDATTRENIKFVFIYHISPASLRKAYEEYIEDPDFKRYKDFEQYWYREVYDLDHPCYLQDTLYHEYCDNVNAWFPPKK